MDKEELAKRWVASDPQTWPMWLQMTRQGVIFVLGVVAIIYSMVDVQKNWAYVITGLFLIGLLPIENLLNRIPRNKPG